MIFGPQFFLGSAPGVNIQLGRVMLITASAVFRLRWGRGLIVLKMSWRIGGSVKIGDITLAGSNFLPCSAVANLLFIGPAPLKV